MTEAQDDLDPTPYIVTEPAPNPYDDPEWDGQQADPGDSAEKVEGLGGTTWPESPLTVNEALHRLHDLAAAHATVDWNGNPIHDYCLRVQHDASKIGAEHVDAQSDCDDNPDKHPVTYADVDWTTVPRGAFVYFSGYAHGHIARFAGVHGNQPLIVSTDVVPSSVGYVDPEWFGQNWGMPLEAWSRACNHTWQQGLDGNGSGQQGGGGGNQGGQGKGGWAGTTEARVAVGILHNQILPPLAKVQKIAVAHDKSPVWDKAAADLTDIAQRIHAVHDALEAVTQPKKG